MTEEATVMLQDWTPIKGEDAIRLLHGNQKMHNVNFYL